MANKIIILGHTGFIGSHLESFLSASKCWNVIGRSLPDIDLTKPEQASLLDIYLQEDTTLVLAAAVKRQFGDTLENYKQNMAIIENICFLLEKHPVKRVVFISSTAVYGEETENNNISEYTLINPTSYYGISKYSAECLLRKACVTNQQTSLVCVRPPLIYGSNDGGRTYGPSGFSVSAMEDLPITLWGDGSELREFIYVEDLCRVIEYLANIDFDGVLNVVSGISYSFVDVINVLREAFPKIQVNMKPRSKQKVNNSFDASKIKSILPADFRFTTLVDGLSRITLDLN